MADDPEPPRKYYALKPREFERANPPAAAAPAPASAPPAVNPAERIDVRDLYRQAAVPGPVLASAPKTRAANDVTAILQDNLGRATAAGLNEIEYRPRPKSRRFRDYLVLMTVILGGFGTVTLHGIHIRAPLVAVFGLGGMIFAAIAVTWVMWFLMDRY